MGRKGSLEGRGDHARRGERGLRPVGGTLLCYRYRSLG